MSIAVNKAYLIGRLGTDPEATSDGALLKIVTTGARKVDSEWTESTDWHRVTAAGTVAAYLLAHAHKGDAIALECAIRSRTGRQVTLDVDRVLWVSARAGRVAS